jgi:hypothetical protein
LKISSGLAAALRDSDSASKCPDFVLDQPFWRRQASYVMDKPIPTFCAGVTVRYWVSGVDCPQTYRRGTPEVIAAPDSEMTP